MSNASKSAPVATNGAAAPSANATQGEVAPKKFIKSLEKACTAVGRFTAAQMKGPKDEENAKLFANGNKRVFASSLAGAAVSAEVSADLLLEAAKREIVAAEAAIDASSWATSW